MIKSYTFLICAILAEALGTTTLKLSLIPQHYYKIFFLST